MVDGSLYAKVVVMSIFVTGATGYLGSYVVAGLLKRYPETRLSLLVRAKGEDEAARRMWRSLQLHMGFSAFEAGLRRQCRLFCGDITRPNLGLDDQAFRALVHDTDSVIHLAGSMNRRSPKSCHNVNLRGTLGVVRLAQEAHAHHGLRRFTHISTMSVSGVRRHAVVTEDDTVSWDRSDYDTYARTKKFAEHLVRELLDDAPTLVVRPTIVLGDSRFAETTQFDMARAYVWLAGLRVVPFGADWRLDLVPADYVGRAIVELHQRSGLAHDAYNVGAGRESPTYESITQMLRARGYGGRRRFSPVLGGWYETAAVAVSRTPRSWGLARPGALFRVFVPYLRADTVYDNRRVVQELGQAPTPFTDYAYPLLRFAKDGGFRYPYRPWPGHGASTR